MNKRKNPTAITEEESAYHEQFENSNRFQIENSNRINVQNDCSPYQHLCMRRSCCLASRYVMEGMVVAYHVHFNKSLLFTFPSFLF